MAKIASKPLNWDAVAAADDAFYAAHPEFVVNGCRVPLDPCDPTQADLRDEWMRLYEDAGGEAYHGRHTPTCDHPVEPCPGQAALMVQVVREDGTPVEGALVELASSDATATTSPDGWADLGMVPAPSAHTVHVTAEGYAQEWGAEQVMRDETAVIVVVLTETADPPDPVPPPPQKRKGHKSPTCIAAREADPDLDDIYERVIMWRDIAFGLGLIEAVSAMNHFLQGSGRFVELPGDYAAKVREQSWATHWPKAEQALKGGNPAGGGPGVKGSLAKALCTIIPAPVPATGGEPDKGYIYAARPEEDWPYEVTVKLSYASGSGAGAIDRTLNPDESVAFAGSVIKSDFEVRCRKASKTGEAARYLCQIEAWDAYVVDNYDWEGDKVLGFKAITDFLFHPMAHFPSQREMLKLEEAGCAKAYQRSSKFWIPKDFSEAPQRIKPWFESFELDDGTPSPEMIELFAAFRTRADLRDERRPRGALPYPGPADDR